MRCPRSRTRAATVCQSDQLGWQLVFRPRRWTLLAPHRRSWFHRDHIGHDWCRGGRRRSSKVSKHNRSNTLVGVEAQPGSGGHRTVHCRCGGRALSGDARALPGKPGIRGVLRRSRRFSGVVRRMAVAATLDTPFGGWRCWKRGSSYALARQPPSCGSGRSARGDD